MSQQEQTDDIHNMQQKHEVTEKPDAQVLENDQGSDVNTESMSSENADDQWSATTVLAAISLCLCYTATYGPYFMTASVFSSLAAILGDTTNAAWIPPAYTLATASFLLISGSLSDIFGRKIFFIMASSLGILSSILGATAKTTNQIIANMAIMGVATAFSAVSTPAFFEIIPQKNRGFAIGALEFSSLPWFMFSSLIANSLVGAGQWRWIYYISLILNVLGLAGILCFYRPPRRREAGKSVVQQLIRLDWLGMLLFMAGITLFLLGIFFGAKATTYAWNTPKVLCCMIIGIMIFALFIVWEVFSTVNHKVLPPVLFTYVRGFDLFCVNMFVTGSFVYAINSYWPVFAQNVYARPGNYTDIGILGIQQGAGVMTGCLILCFLTKRVKHLRIQLIIAISWQVIWVGLLCTLTPTSKGAAEAFIYLGGIGVSWTIGVCLTSISLAVPHKWIGAATGAANCFRLTGATIGLAVYSAILSSKISGELAAQVIPAANAAGLPPSSDKAALAAASVFSGTAFNNVPGINSTIIAAIRYAKAEAYIDVYKYLWYTSIAFGLLGVICAVFVKEMDYLLTNHIALDLVKAKRLLGKGHTKDAEAAEEQN